MSFWTITSPLLCVIIFMVTNAFGIGHRVRQRPCAFAPARMPISVGGGQRFRDPDFPARAPYRTCQVTKLAKFFVSLLARVKFLVTELGNKFFDLGSALLFGGSFGLAL